MVLKSSLDVIAINNYVGQGNWDMNARQGNLAIMVLKLSLDVLVNQCDWDMNASTLYDRVGHMVHQNSNTSTSLP